MTSRELVIKTLNQVRVPRVPRDLWLPSGEEDAARAHEIAEMGVRYPSDIVQPDVPPPHGKKSSNKPNRAGNVTDAWGCVWHDDESGSMPTLTSSPLSEANKIASYQPPAELLDRSRFSKVNRSCATTNRFVLAWSDVRPFDRLRYLRGPDAARADLARGTKDIRTLLAMLHDFALKEIELWAKTDVDAVCFRDDWGTAEGLAVAPEIWREVFRPLYKEYCSILQAHDKFVFFQSAGNISDIFGDLVKVGLDAIHCELHLMNVARLAKRYRGRVTFWGAMDPQRLENPGSLVEFREAVIDLRKVLDSGSGGVIAQCQWDAGVRMQTIAAFFEQWIAPLGA